MKAFKALVIFLLISHAIFAQVAINDDNSTPESSAMLDIKSIDKGVLVPRMTSEQRTSISGPANGLLVFDSETESFWFYGTGGWTELIDRENASWSKNSDDIYYNNGDVGIGTNSPIRQLHTAANNSFINTSQFLVQQSGTGDAFMNLGLAGSHHYSMGVDNSDGGKFKIGYNASGPFGVSSTTRLTLTPSGWLGLGATNPSDRLQIDALSAEPAFRVRQGGAIKVRVHSNGGTSIGANSTPPVDGLLVIGDIEPFGKITTNQNLLVESTGAGTNIQLQKDLSSLSIDDSGMYGNVRDNIRLETTMENNKLEMNGNGLAASSDSNIQIQSSSGNITVETFKNIGMITIKAGSKEIIVDENGGITINSGGNNVTINTSGGDFNVDAGNGNINLSGRDIEFTASNLLNAFSDDKILLESRFGDLELKSNNNMFLNSGAMISQLAGTEFTLTSGLDLNLDAGLTLDLDGSTSMTLNAALISLNNGSLGAARRLDTTVGTAASQVINTASSSVLIGN
jgi:hypothetical protein